MWGGAVNRQPGDRAGNSQRLFFFMDAITLKKLKIKKMNPRSAKTKTSGRSSSELRLPPELSNLANLNFNMFFRWELIQNMLFLPWIFQKTRICHERRPLWWATLARPIFRKVYFFQSGKESLWQLCEVARWTVNLVTAPKLAEVVEY